MKTLRHLLYFLLVMSSLCCKHKLEDHPFIGPEITPEDFQVNKGTFTPYYAQVDFETQKQSFTASFSNKVKWTLTLRGLESKAVKTLTGTASSLDASNTLWDGTADSVYFFKTGEKCQATLTFFNSTLSLSDTFGIQKEKKYEGLLIDDFETTTTDKVGIILGYTDSGDSDTLIVFRDSTNKVQGNSSLLLSGTDANGNYWIEGVQTAVNAFAQKVEAVKADKLYVNLSVYGSGNKNAGLALKLFEDDNASGAYENASDDAFTYLLAVDWKGWKRISIPYSQFIDDSDTTGNNVAEPAHLLRLNLALVSYSSSLKTSVNTDYILFTTGVPLKGSLVK